MATVYFLEAEFVMLYFFLMKNSLRQHKAAYFYIFAVLFLSVFTVAFFSAYADSISYGEQIQTIEVTKGANIEIHNADEEDISLFKSLENITIWYEDGTIYISCDRISESEEIAYKTTEIINDSKKDFHMVFNDPSMFTALFEQNFVTVIKFIMCAVSLISIYYVFNVFIERQHHDFIIYKSLGMCTRQFTIIVGIEFLVILMLAIFSAIPAAGSVIKGFLSLYFEAKIPLSAIGYAVYRFQLKKKLFVVVLTLLTASFAYCVTIYKYFGSHSLGKSLSNLSFFRRTDSVMKKKSIYTMIPFVKFWRNRKLTIISMVLIVPVFGYTVYETNHGYQTYDKKYGCDFVISDSDIEDLSALKQTDINQLLEFPCVEKVQYSYYNNNFKEKSVDGTDPYIGRAAFQVIYDGSLQTADDNSKNSIYINEIYRDKYKTGDRLEIVSTQTKQEFEVEVTGYYKTASPPTYLTFYCTIESFKDLTGIETTPRTLYVYLKEDTTEQELTVFREWIENTFPSYSDEIKNSENSKIMNERTEKVNSLRAVSMLLTASITLWAILMLEVDSRHTEISVMYSIGAEKKQLHKLLLIEMGIRSIVCSGLTMSMDIAAGFLKNSASFKFENFIVYVGITLIIAANFVIPSQIALNNICKRQKKEMEHGNIDGICFE